MDMTKYKILLLALVLFLCKEAISQTKESTFLSKSCKLSCGAEFTYNSKITIYNDTIRIYTLSGGVELVVNQYKILKKKEKWAEINYQGIANYRVIQLSDSSKKDIRMELKSGCGTINIIDKNSYCEIKLVMGSK